jgi:hypothetical protein
MLRKINPRWHPLSQTHKPFLLQRALRLQGDGHHRTALSRLARDVRFWHLADISGGRAHVRFWG